MLLLALLLAPPAADAYPKLLVKEKRCASALTAGEVIMGQPVMQGKGQTVTVRFVGRLVGWLSFVWSGWGGMRVYMSRRTNPTPHTHIN